SRYLSEQAYAARRRYLSMDKARLQRVCRIYRGVESLVAFDHRDRARRNVYHHEHFLRARSQLCLDARKQMVRLANQHHARGRSRFNVRSRFVVRQVASQRRRLRHAPGLRRTDLSAAARSVAWRIEKLSPASARAAHDVDLLLLQYFQQTIRRRIERI